MPVSEECEKCRMLAKDWERAQLGLSHTSVLAHLSQSHLESTQRAADQVKKARDDYFEHRRTHAR
jgi:hypothetical protein